MALTAVQTAMNLEERKSIHPFFSKPPRESSPDRSTERIDAAPALQNADEEAPAPTAEPPKARKKRARKSDGSKKERANVNGNQSSLESFTLKHKSEVALPATNVQPLQEPAHSHLEEDPNESRRKRRKTVSPNPEGTKGETNHEGAKLEWHQQLQVEAEKAVPAGLEGCTPMDIEQESGSLDAERAPATPIQDSGNQATDAPREPADDVAVRRSPRRVLKVNKNGKLLSPGSEKLVPEHPASPRKKRARKATKTASSPTVTIINYGSDAASRRAFGEKIDNILNGKKPAKSAKASAKKVAAKPTGPPKVTHPFFMGKSAPAKEFEQAANAASELAPPPQKPPRKSAVTPGKLRAQGWSNNDSQPVPAFGPIAGDSRLPKHPGLSDALWPSKGTSHVRNIDESSELQSIANVDASNLRKDRKLKCQASHIPPDEDLINQLSSQLRSTMSDDSGAHESEQLDHVRMPDRLLTTGADIQRRLLMELRGLPTHPALRHIYDDIEHTLTPFDKGECEQQTWVHKYAPSCASQVLQSGKEVLVLRDWLQNLTVMSVENGKDGKDSSTGDLRRQSKKRRKRAEDDFIVDDFAYESDDEMIEISDTEGHDHSQPRLRSLKLPRPSRDKNVVLVSGPHGSSKSAAVYAVAKELGFEVFEINSGSRRSGKDIQDKVGDMTANHLVNHKRQDHITKQDIGTGDDTDNERNSAAFQKDLDSGRQGTMTSFFKNVSQVVPKPKPSAKIPKKKVDTPAQATIVPRKTQKQSLILFEEADVLFEEDQQFWAQVTKLASQSKRPIIITCNSEAQIPIYSLPLAAILRLTPPPLDLATDYMLTIAAKEGHLLAREAVSSLFESKRRDLRASITELDFWCQMSVGDRKGGLEWIYQRWPPGKDVDEQGRSIRVASQRTYQTGFGWLSHDIFSAPDNVGFSGEEELLKEAWVDWALSPPWKGSISPEQQLSPNHRAIDELAHFDAMLESISAADVYCRVNLPSYEGQFQEPIDSSIPPIREKDRSSYTSEAPVLQCGFINDFSAFDTSMFVQSQMAIQRVYGRRSSDALPELYNVPTDERQMSAAILGHVQSSHIPKALTRLHFSDAFDILAESPTATSSSTSYQLIASSFDRTFQIVVEDLAPYVRAIVAYEMRLDAERIRLGNLLSEGGRGKRARTTKASRTALEGGTRETKRKEKWFENDLNRALVMGTAGPEWSGLGGIGEESSEATSAIGAGDSVPSTQE